MSENETLVRGFGVLCIQLMDGKCLLVLCSVSERSRIRKDRSEIRLLKSAR